MEAVEVEEDVRARPEGFFFCVDRFRVEDEAFGRFFVLGAMLSGERR